MAFDLLAWVLKSGLSASAAAVKKQLWSKTLSSELGNALEAWAARLSPEASLVPSALFPRVVDHEEMADRPALMELQQQLLAQRIPTVVQWHQALIEHWLRVRAAAGREAQPFFLLAEDAARPLLHDLARAMVSVCEREEAFFRPAVIDHLEALRADVPLLPEALQHSGAVDVRGLATRINDLGVGVFLIVHDVNTKSLWIWVQLADATVAEWKSKWAAIAALASDAPDTALINIGWGTTHELRGTDGGGHIGTIRICIPIQAARRLAATRGVAAEFWQNVEVYVIEPDADNTVFQRWARIPFSNLEVPLASSR